MTAGMLLLIVVDANAALLDSPRFRVREAATLALTRLAYADRVQAHLDAIKPRSPEVARRLVSIRENRLVPADAVTRFLARTPQHISDCCGELPFGPKDSIVITDYRKSGGTLWWEYQRNGETVFSVTIDEADYHSRLRRFVAKRLKAGRPLSGE